MARKNVRVMSLVNGIARLEDGREMQLVMADTGSLGLVPLTREDHMASLDQESSPVVKRPPTLVELGLDQG